MISSRGQPVVCIFRTYVCVLFTLYRFFYRWNCIKGVYEYRYVARASAVYQVPGTRIDNNSTHEEGSRNNLTIAAPACHKKLGCYIRRPAIVAYCCRVGCVSKGHLGLGRFTIRAQAAWWLLLLILIVIVINQKKGLI